MDVGVEYSEVCDVDWGDAGITKLCWWPYWQRRCCSANREPRPKASSACAWQQQPNTLALLARVRRRLLGFAVRAAYNRPATWKDFTRCYGGMLFQ